MAYYNNPDDDDNNPAQGMNNEQEQQDSSTAPVQLSNKSSTAGSGPVSGINNAPQATKTTKPASSGSGPSFSSYSKANQGNAQQSLNSAVAQNVSNAGQSAQNSINQATQKFSTKADQGALGGEQSRSTAVSDVQGTVDSARNLTAGNNVDQSQQDRFKQVINAQYTGPESLRQAGLYDPASQKAQAAQSLIDNSKSALGREDLLRQMYSQRGDYTAGLNKLDSALLNASQQGVQNLQNTAEAQGNLGQKLDQAQIGSAATAQNRTQEVKDIRNQARDTFSTGKAAEEAATEERLASVVENWEQLPEYFRDIIRNKAKDNAGMEEAALNQFKTDNNYNQISSQVASAQQELQAAQNAHKAASRLVGGDLFGGTARLANPAAAQAATIKVQEALQKLNTLNSQKSELDTQLSNLQQQYANKNAVNLNSLEAGILGINSGEGLYNLGANAIKSGVADKEKLISRDEQARQAALASLAGLDLSNQLDTNLLYGNAEKAGTQTAMDALDLAATRAALNEAEQGFRDTAEGTTLTGTGRGKASKGNAFGSKSKSATASFSGNAADFLKKAGYDFDSEIGSGQDTLGSQQELLRAALNAANRKELSPDMDITSAAINTGLGPITGSPDPVSNFQDLLSSAGLGGISDAIQGGRNIAADTYSSIAKYDPMSITANAIGNALGLGSLTSNIASVIGGIDTKALKNKAQAKANAAATADLTNKYTQFLDSQGFDNRLNVADNATTTARMDALQQLLANLDKTNT